MCHLYMNIIRTLNFNIRLFCDGQYFKINMNLEYTTKFIRIN